MEEDTLQSHILVSNFVNEYEDDFSKFKDRIRSSIVDENLLNQQGLILVMNTLDSMKDTMNPLSHSVSDRYVMGSRNALAARLQDLTPQLLIYHEKYVNPEEDITNFLFRLQQNVFAFNDKWLGRYKQENKAKGITIIIQIKELYLSLMNWIHK
jgi:hypothetical protein